MSHAAKNLLPDSNFPEEPFFPSPLVRGFEFGVAVFPDLFGLAFQLGLRRDVADGAAQAHCVVVLDKLGHDLPGLLQGQGRLVLELAQRVIRLVVDRLPLATAKRGIRTTRWARRFLALAAVPGENRYILGGTMDPARYRSLFSWERVPPGKVWDHYHARSLRQRLEANGLGYLTRMCLADTEVYLPDHNLTYSDKCTMAAGVESRPPLTDHRIVEFMFSLAPTFRIRNGRQKFLLKKVAQSYLPKEIVHRPKAPFGAPLRAWIRGGLSEMVQDYLSIDCLKRRGIYNPQFVREAIENDRQGKEDNAHLIWRLLCNELWFRTFFS